MNNRNYCCYRHFKEGKHEPSCTHCFDHVQLGVINPVHSPGRQPIKESPPPLNVRSKTFRIENRTHDYNEVENKDSLPERLKKPRVYVEKLVDKFERTQPLLPIKHSGSAQYETTVKLFRKIGQSLPQKTKQSLISLIRQFSLQKRYTRSSQQSIFLTKPQFIEFIIQNFPKFSHQQAEQFWDISYNELRFKDRISMEAFVFNFNKFYLQIENINNTFSEPALRQRVIDLRVLLFDWAQNQTAFKFNMRSMREEIADIEEELKLSNNQEMYCDFRMAVQKCRLAHIKLRFLSEVLFNLTDNKFLHLQKLKSSIHQKLQQRVRKLETSREVLRKFFETNNLAPSQKFAITDILEFCKLEGSSEQVMADVISWIQGLFDYLFYHKPEDEELGLTLNLETRRLQCVNILNVDANMVREYDAYVERLSDLHVDCCRELLALLQDGLSKMPILDGHKKDVVECNYVAEIVLRFIRAIDLSPFWRVALIVTESRFGLNYKKIAEILKTKPSQEEIKKNMKGLFILAPSSSQTQRSNNKQNSRASQFQDETHRALKKYKKVKEEGLVLKLAPQAKNQEQQKQDQLDKLLNQNQKNISSGAVKLQENEAEMEKYLDHGMSNYCCSKYLLDVSKETNETISAVESLESRLFSLLNLDNCNC